MFGSFLLGGFECSSHRRHDGRRLDLLASSGHAAWCARDYQTLASLGLKGARDGLRWHLIEARPNRYDWASFLPMLRAARDAGLRIAWDLCHYGWPDDVDIWSPAFVDRFATFAGAVARLVCDETGDTPIFCPVNEISFWAWAGGDVARMNPNAHGRGAELKRQLVRAAIAAIEAVRDEAPHARFLYAEPAIHVDGGAGGPEQLRAAEAYRLSQFEALDMISGRLAPQLGGAPEYLDLVGVNYYPENQWYLNGGTIPMGHHAYRPFSDILQEVYDRYGRPLLVAETGAEGSGRAAWLHYVAAETLSAVRRGVPVGGICVYPILDCPGWANDRLCPVGLLSSAGDAGTRTVFAPLQEEIASAEAKFATELPPTSSNFDAPAPRRYDMAS